LKAPQSAGTIQDPQQGAVSLFTRATNTQCEISGGLSAGPSFSGPAFSAHPHIHFRQLCSHRPCA